MQAINFTACCAHYIKRSIYAATPMSKMITLPEEYPKHTLPPENDDETKSR